MGDISNISDQIAKIDKNLWLLSCHKKAISDIMILPMKTL